MEAAEQAWLRWPRPWFSVCRERTPPVLESVGPFEVTITLPASLSEPSIRHSAFSCCDSSLTGLSGWECKRGWAGGTPGFEVAEWCVARPRHLYIPLCSCSWHTSTLGLWDTQTWIKEGVGSTGEYFQRRCRTKTAAGPRSQLPHGRGQRTRKGFGNGLELSPCHRGQVTYWATAVPCCQLSKL